MKTSPDKAMKPTAPIERTQATLPRRPAVAYLFLVRRYSNVHNDAKNTKYSWVDFVVHRCRDAVYQIFDASHQGFRATYLAFVVRALVRSPWNRADYYWFPSPARR
jgi:hypothetical protein